MTGFLMGFLRPSQRWRRPHRADPHVQPSAETGKASWASWSRRFMVRSGLSSDAVVDIALDVVDGEGPAALTLAPATTASTRSLLGFGSRRQTAPHDAGAVKHQAQWLARSHRLRQGGPR
jgi:hypothetical protein